ncbi:unnamed protein product [Choristocarpus tenellus]
MLEGLGLTPASAAVGEAQGQEHEPSSTSARLVAIEGLDMVRDVPRGSTTFCLQDTLITEVAGKLEKGDTRTHSARDGHSRLTWIRGEKMILRVRLQPILQGLRCSG